MSRRSRLDRLTRWTALVALVLATLAPSLAHALRHARGEMLPWSQVCSTTGALRVVAAADPGGTPAQARTHAFDQCLYCALHHDGVAPPAAVALPATPAAIGEPLPATALPSPRPALARGDAQPRAPPRRA